MLRDAGPISFERLLTRQTKRKLKFKEQNFMTVFFVFLEEARALQEGVLIHCFAGISRSVTITIAYIMHSMSYTLNQAFDFVRRKRANISPNFNFMGQLQDFEHLLLSRSQCRCSCPKTTAPSSFSFAKTTTTSSSATTLTASDVDGDVTVHRQHGDGGASVY